MVDWLRKRLGLMPRQQELQFLQNLETAIQTTRALVIATADCKTKIAALEAKIASWEKPQ